MSGHNGHEAPAVVPADNGHEGPEAVPAGNGHEAPAVVPAGERSEGRNGDAAGITELANAVEALLFLSEDPVQLADLAEAMGRTEQEVGAAAAVLGERHAASRSGLRLRELAGGLTLASAPEHEEAARRLLGRRRLARLSPAQMETLAIIAYLQPISRPEMSRMRGVSADSATAALLERDLVEEAGRSEFGATLYRTTTKFLMMFGLNALSDLPDPARWDPSPAEEKDLRERLLAAGDARAGDARSAGSEADG